MTNLRLNPAAAILSLFTLSFAGALHAQGTMPASKVGIFRQGFFWILDSDGSTQFNSPDVDFPFGGVAGDIPITGDWNGDGRTKVGIYRAGGYFLLDYNGDGHFDASVDKFFNLGVGSQPGDVPVVGDWNGDGRTKVGLFRQGYFWILDYNGDGVFQSGIDKSFAFGGIAGDVPVVGDWNGTHVSKVGVFRSGYTWVLDGNNPGDSVHNVGWTFAFGGIAGDVPVVGDWNNSGMTSVGVFRNGYYWVLDASTPTGGSHSVGLAFPFGGLSGDMPVVGKWKTAFVTPSGVDPSAGTGASGTPQQFTVHYTDLYGPADITYGQILFNSNPNGPDGTGACQVEWNSAGALNLLSSAGNIDGSFGQVPPSPLSNANCSIDTVNSRLTPTAGGYDVVVRVTFTNQFSASTTVHQIYALGENVEGLSSGWVNVGSWTVPRGDVAMVQIPADSGSGAYVYNDNVSKIVQDVKCSRGADCTTAACSVSPSSNVTATPVNQTFTSAQISLTADHGAVAGARTLTCSASGATTLPTIVSVYDATPVVTSVERYDVPGSRLFVQGEGAVGVRILGRNFEKTRSTTPAG